MLAVKHTVTYLLWIPYAYHTSQLRVVSTVTVLL